MTGRIIAIGDIHGHVTALDAVIDALKPTDQDTLIFLGDYVDRGPESKAVIERLMELQEQYHCRFIMGNHEEMMFEAYYSPDCLGNEWLRIGGSDTIASYGCQTMDEFTQKADKAHIKFLTKCEDAVELGDYVFVHAAWEPDTALSEQDRATLRYQFLEKAQDTGHKRIICGHTPQKSGKPVQKGQITCIDTGMGLIPDGLLTAYDLTNERFIQSDRKGNVTSAPAKDLLQPFQPPSQIKKNAFKK